MPLQLTMIVLIPGMLLFGLWQSKYSDRLEWFVQVSCGAAYVLLVFLVGRWDLVGYPSRWVVVLLYGIAAWYAYRSRRDPPGRPIASPPPTP